MRVWEIMRDLIYGRLVPVEGTLLDFERVGALPVRAGGLTADELQAMLTERVLHPGTSEAAEELWERIHTRGMAARYVFDCYARCWREPRAGSSNPCDQ
jgi:hypothetical protein